MGESAVTDLLAFLDHSGSPYHAVLSVRERLDGAGFKRLRHDKPWELERGDKYYVTLDHSTIFAFAVGANWTGNSDCGIVLVGSHTDSPCLRVRPNHILRSGKSALLGVELYGGGLWRTWFDRGLGFAGKVLVRDGKNIKEVMVSHDDPITLIPNLAIHLGGGEEGNMNKETEIRPVIQLIEDGEQQDNNDDINRVLRSVIAEDLKISEDQIVSMDIRLKDAQKSLIWGMKKEFIASPRLDNLLSVWASTTAMCQISDKDLNDSCDIMGMIAWDHEEVGSVSWQGACSAVLKDWLKRVVKAVSVEAEPCMADIMSRSFILSVDGAHGLHPNYSEKYQSQNAPIINRGVVVKQNANQKYCTSARSTALLEAVAREAECKLQYFVVRNDSRCGSTIGPLSTCELGVSGIDVGAPMWAMHSIRESCGTKDVIDLCQLIYKLFRKYQTLREEYSEY